MILGDLYSYISCSVAVFWANALRLAFSLYLPSLCWMSQHQDWRLCAKLWQTIVPLFTGLFIYFWVFSARICPIKSLRGRSNIPLHPAFEGHSINSPLVLLQVFACGLQKSPFGKCAVYFFLTIFWYHFPWLIVVFFITRWFREIHEVSKCAWCCYWGNLPQRILEIETSHLSDTVCAWRGGLFSRNTMFGLKCLTKGTWSTRTLWGFKIRSFNSRWHSKYHPFLSIWCSLFFFQKPQSSLSYVSGCRIAARHREVLFPTPQPSWWTGPPPKQWWSIDVF